MFIPSPPPPSRQAEELGEQLALFVGEYREDNPDVSAVDIERAFLVARDQLRRTTGCASASGKAVAIAAGLAVTFGVGVFAFFMRSGGGGGGGAVASQPWLIYAIGGAVVLLALIAVAVRRCR